MARTSRFSAKQERCIRKVKAKGFSKVSAIKICQSRIKKKDIMAGKKRKKARYKNRRQRRKARLKALAQERMLEKDKFSEEEEAQDAELVEEIVEELSSEIPEDIDTESDQLLDIIDNLSDEEVEEVIEEVAEVVEDEVEEKHFVDSIGVPFSGATSFDELEEEREAREKTSKARGVAWDAEDIISNVIRNPLLKAGEKTKKISQAAKDMEERINSVLGETKEIDNDPSPSEAVGLLVNAVLQKIGLSKNKKESNSFYISKDLNGDLRWVGKATNRWFDKDEDILTNASHKEFVDYLNENPDMAPEFWPWHNVKAAFTHPVDSWMYKNGFMVYSGKLEEAEAKSLIEASKKTRLGMSHGFFALDREKTNNKNITKYRTFEVSVLPLHNAANPYTELEVIAKEANMERKEFLTELIGKEKADKYLQEIEKAEEDLDEAGVKTKDVVDPQENVLMEQIGKELGLPELSSAFTEIVKELKELREGSAARDIVIKAMAKQLDITEEEQTEQLAKMIEAPAGRFAWQRAADSKENLVDEKKDKKLLDSAPELNKEHWLGKATHTQSMRATKEEIAQLV